MLRKIIYKPRMNYAKLISAFFMTFLIIFKIAFFLKEEIATKFIFWSYARVNWRWQILGIKARKQTTAVYDHNPPASHQNNAPNHAPASTMTIGNNYYTNLGVPLIREHWCYRKFCIRHEERSRKKLFKEKKILIKRWVLRCRGFFYSKDLPSK